MRKDFYSLGACGVFTQFTLTDLNTFFLQVWWFQSWVLWSRSEKLTAFHKNIGHSNNGGRAFYKIFLKGTVEFISFQPIHLGILCIPCVLCSLKNKRWVGCRSVWQLWRDHQPKNSNSDNSFSYLAFLCVYFFNHISTQNLSIVLTYWLQQSIGIEIFCQVMWILLFLPSQVCWWNERYSWISMSTARKLNSRPTPNPIPSLLLWNYVFQ